jgi:hypothetical protein
MSLVGRAYDATWGRIFAASYDRMLAEQEEAGSADRPPAGGGLGGQVERVLHRPGARARVRHDKREETQCLTSSC